MEKRRISGNELVKDIRNGMDDAAIIKKHQISQDKLEIFFDKLIKAGVLTQAEIDARKRLLQTEVLFECPACGSKNVDYFEECPACGIVVSKFERKTGRKYLDRKTDNQPTKASPQPVSDSLVWVQAFVPLAAILIDAAFSWLWSFWVVIVTNSMLCYFDKKHLEKAKLDTGPLGYWWILLVPVYLFRRVRVVGGGYGYAICWMVTFFIGVLLFPASGLGPRYVYNWHTPRAVVVQQGTGIPVPEGRWGLAQQWVDTMNQQQGDWCRLELSGWFGKTLKLDWTERTTSAQALGALAGIGSIKEILYANGVRYFQYPNDAGTYNVVDWKTGDRTSISERAPYYFR
jgi:hypothetical protein